MGAENGIKIPPFIVEKNGEYPVKKKVVGITCASFEGTSSLESIANDRSAVNQTLASSRRVET